MRVAALLILVGAAVTASPEVEKFSEQRIIGGSVTTIEQYPHAVAMLGSHAPGVTFRQTCGGTILNIRSVLSAAHCFEDMLHAHMWRSRVGSTYAHSGGFLFDTQKIIMHPHYVVETFDNDIAIVRLSGFLTYSNVIQPVSIAGPNYNLADDQALWAIGWGRTSNIWARPSEQLRHVQFLSINQEICRLRYADARLSINDNMLCTGWLDVGRRDQCVGDSGGPVYHNNVQVGVCSFSELCADRFYPSVQVRVSRVAQWIVNNA